MRRRSAARRDFIDRRRSICNVTSRGAGNLRRTRGCRSNSDECLRHEVFCRVETKFLFAARAAKVESFSRECITGFGPRRLNLHSADRVCFHGAGGGIVRNRRPARTRSCGRRNLRRTRGHRGDTCDGLGRHIFFWVGDEFLLATWAAEVIHSSGVLVRRFRPRRIDRHSANRVFFQSIDGVFGVHVSRIPWHDPTCALRGLRLACASVAPVSGLPNSINGGNLRLRMKKLS